MAYEITTNPLRGVEATLSSGHYGVFDHGAHIWSFQPQGQAPVLWVSEKSWFADGQPVRGGVPVCFPWFAAGPTGDLEPNHGFTRLHTWHMSDIKDTLDRDGRLLVEYEIDQAMTGRQDGFPHRYTAYLRAKFTPEYLGIALEVTNTGDDAFTFEEALHTYLHVGDVRQIRIAGLEDAHYLDKVTGATDLVQSGDLRIGGEIDRIYTHAGDLLIDDPVLGRKLVVTKTGSANTVVWNPGPEKAAEIADFGDDEWTQVVSVEAANVGTQAISLRPGETHLLKQRITVA